MGGWGIVRTLHSATCPPEMGSLGAPEAHLCGVTAAGSQSGSLSWREEASDWARTWLVSSFLIPQPRKLCQHKDALAAGEGVGEFQRGPALTISQLLGHLTW